MEPWMKYAWRVFGSMYSVGSLAMVCLTNKKSLAELSEVLAADSVYKDLIVNKVEYLGEVFSEQPCGTHMPQ